MSIWQQLLIIFLLASAGYLLFYFTRSRLNLAKINKKYVLIVMLIATFLPFFFPKFYLVNYGLQYIQLFVAYYLMFIFIELYRRDKIAKNAPIVGKPKAKPNRIKK